MIIGRHKRGVGKEAILRELNSQESDASKRSAQDSVELVGCLEAQASYVRLVRYNWTCPTTDVWTSEGYFLHMCLSTRDGPAQATYLDSNHRISGDIGRVLFVPPGLAMKSGGSSGSQLSLLCSLAPALIEGILERRPVWHDNTLAQGLRLKDPEVDWFLLRIYREILQPGFAQDVMAEVLIKGLAIALIRALKLDREEPSRSIGGLAPWRLRLIEERVHAERPAPRLTELADLCGMSVRHLGRAFKTETGQTLGQFVEWVTIERARAFLNETDIPVTEIAERLGFSTRAGFVYSFRRVTGSSPSELRSGLRRSAPAVAMAN